MSENLFDTARGFEACIFDCDGVVLDTEKLHFKAWNEGFAYVGLTLSEAEYQPLKSTGRSNALKFAAEKLGRGLTENEAQSICDIKDNCFKKLCESADESLIIKGVKDFLEKLRARGTKTAVASSASTSKELLGRLSLTEYFDAIVDGTLGLPKKPEPDIFLTAAKLIATQPENCLVFEDSPAGIAAAINAGMAVVAVGGIAHHRAILTVKGFVED